MNGCAVFPQTVLRHLLLNLTITSIHTHILMIVAYANPFLLSESLGPLYPPLDPLRLSPVKSCLSHRFTAPTGHLARCAICPQRGMCRYGALSPIASRGCTLSPRRRLSPWLASARRVSHPRPHVAQRLRQSP